MTRIFRIEFCDHCPNLRHGCGEPLRCAAAKEDWNGYQISRRIRTALSLSKTRRQRKAEELRNGRRKPSL